MQRFKQQVDQLQHQLAGLTTGQKAFAIALGGAMLLAVVWWTRLAGADEMVPLFHEPTAANTPQITAALTGRGIDCEIRGEAIYLPSKLRGEAIAALASDRLLPTDSRSTLGEAIDKIGSFDVRQKIDARLLNATREELRYAIEELPGVASASLFLNPVYKRQIGESVFPSASVVINTNKPTDVHLLSEAISFLLANAIPALEPDRVAVLIDGSLISASGGDDLSARERHARGEAERDFAAKVHDALGAIPGLVASVTVDMPARTGQRPVAVALEPVDEPSAEAADEGPLDLEDIYTLLSTPASGPSSSSINANADRPDHRPYVPTGGSLVVPMSWIIQQWQSRNRTSELPPPEELAQFEHAKLEELRRSTAIALKGISTEQISIIVDADLALAGEEELPPMLTDSLEDSPAISALVHNWGREVALAAMGAVSVLLVSAMLKKSAAGGVVITESTLAFGPEGIDPAALEYLAEEPLFASEQVLEQARSMLCGDAQA